MPHARNTPKTVPPFQQVGNELVDIETAVELDRIHLDIAALRGSIARLALAEALEAIHVFDHELIVAGLDEEQRLL